MKNNKIIKITLTFDDMDSFSNLVGFRDENLKTIQELIDIELYVRGNIITIKGSESNVDAVKTVLQGLYKVAKKGKYLGPKEVELALRQLEANPEQPVEKTFLEGITFGTGSVFPKTPGQRLYVEAISRYDIVFAIGPAGTGKTYLAMAAGISALMSKRVSRIILTRPAVEAGERLGFLPGNLVEKVNPYLRPLYDALHDMIGMEKGMELMERGVIEIAPLAFMRGRTLNNSFVILDEAQNTSIEQMKMFLTRLGYDSRAIITGDVTQVDLPSGKPSGLMHAARILKDIEGIKFVYLTKRDVVRHPLVQKIIQAYEEDENRYMKGKDHGGVTEQAEEEAL